ncbi:MAG: YbaB/EbfC family nucleoid-associated protein [bacterium]
MTDSSKGPDLQALFGKMQEFQGRMEQMQQTLAKETVEAEAGGGMVKAVANGRREILSVSIEPEVANAEDLEMLQDLVVAAVNAALSKAETIMKEKLESSLGQMTGGVLPNMFG